MPSSTFTSVLALTLALPACADSAHTGPTPTPAAGPVPIRAASARPEEKQDFEAAQELTDEQVLGVLSAGIGKIVTLADYAMAAGVDSDVRTHAAALVSRYSTYRDSQTEATHLLGLGEQPSLTKQAIDVGLETDFTVLMAVNRSDFDRSFLTQIVGDQQGLLRLLDRVVLPNTTSPRLQVLVDVWLRHVLETNLEESLRLYRRVAQIAG